MGTKIKTGVDDAAAIFAGVVGGEWIVMVANGLDGVGDAVAGCKIFAALVLVEDAGGIRCGCPGQLSQFFSLFRSHPRLATNVKHVLLSRKLIRKNRSIRRYPNKLFCLKKTLALLSIFLLI